MAIIIAAYLYSLFSLPAIDPGEARIADGKLVMNNPKISGADSNNRPYTLTAVRAVQDAAKQAKDFNDAEMQKVTSAFQMPGMM